MLTDLVDEVTTLPALPPVVTRVLSLVNDPRTQSKAVAELIVREPVLGARVLKLANSAYYGLPQKISNINRAIVVIGFSTLRTVVLSASMMGGFRVGAATGFNRAKFWKHSIVCSTVGRELAKRTNGDPELAFSVGLLHDIGKLIIDFYAPLDMEKILRKAERESLPFVQAETMADIKHAEIGAELAGEWELEPDLQEAIRTHHERESAQDEILHSAISFANYLCHVMGLPAGSFNKPALDRLSWIKLGLRQDDLPELLAMVKREVELADAILCASS